MSPLDAVRGARLPAAALETLADLRRDPGLAVVLDDQCAWLVWRTADDDLVLRLMAIAGVALYDRRDGLWYSHGSLLPEFGLPLDADEAKGLHAVVVPQPMGPSPPGQPIASPMTLRLVRDARPRPVTALRCTADALARWAETATSARLERLSATWDKSHVLVRGREVPEVLSADRFWGIRILVPLGFRPEPELPEQALLNVLGAEDEDLFLLEPDGCEVVPLGVFQTLSRASLRLALEGATG
jgi:hypothetical protein